MGGRVCDIFSVGKFHFNLFTFRGVGRGRDFKDGYLPDVSITSLRVLGGGVGSLRLYFPLARVGAG